MADTKPTCYKDMSREELIDRLVQKEAHVKQLRNIIAKSNGEGQTSKKKKAQRPFDFTKYNFRHVALKIAYLGWDYQGFAVQEDTDKTIEGALFEAMTKTRLIESRETSCYHRCGRTDKGVSAFGQVISIDLRSNLQEGKGVKPRSAETPPEKPSGDKTEIDYPHILNKVLPPEIRVLAWCPVEPDFSARFSCLKRTYKYYFPAGSLNLKVMQEAGLKLIGEHDFRNFCKMDVAHGVTNFVRRIVEVELTVLNQESEHGGYEMCELTVVGLAFLWHQIRCIVAVLFLIGQGKEEVQLVDQLLDVVKNPQKPQYTMAAELPLVLFECEFENVDWIYDKEWHIENIRHLQELWTTHMIRATMLKRMLDSLSNCVTKSTRCKGEQGDDATITSTCESKEVRSQPNCLNPDNLKKTYIPLMQRQKCESLESRIEHFVKRRKIEPPADERFSVKTEETERSDKTDS